jgi:hypothetical protein
MQYRAGIALVGLVLVVPVRSQAADGLREREKAAKKACAAGDYRQGVEILAGLYVDTDNATHIFNQARCYEQNHQWVSALDRFREYMRKNPNAPASVKADVEKHIAECESLQEKEEAKQAPAASPLTTASSPPSATMGAPQATAVGQTASPSGSRGSGLRVASIVLASAGVATAVTGLVLNLKANSLADDFNRTQDPATRSSSSSYKTGSMICYGVGAGALVAAGVLYLIGRSADGSENTSLVSFLPALTPTGFSLDVLGPF